LDVAVLVESKNENQARWQPEGEFVPTGPEYDITAAQSDADELMTTLLVNHTGGAKEYRSALCVTRAYEQRPV
jgi:hypothetical protein